ncbi:hypothetical protein [Actinokineospora diospyrosa]|uniref:Uncharacterized protein n=1 Tax=Actinokineospora diospyrosa TaxID=103728 RepID=A0ABT1IJT4_9PSEU|nr:hypothetical protein [Actinokineospora diospyrosa]MCP2272910.1 hypothetical protein [Actinokineospora diospyrosa]
MLFIVLALVLGAFGLLVAALTTANTVWAWISVVISVVAAAILLVDWLGARRNRAPATTAPPGPLGAPDIERIDPAVPVEPHTFSAPPSFADQRTQVDRFPAADQGPDGTAVDSGSAGSLTDSGSTDGGLADANSARVDLADHAGVDAAPVDQDREPDEESTDAADLLVVSDLRVDVRVLDERPRYHLTRCGWLGGRSSIPLPVAEARQLGFTPCGHCTPDAVLAARHRAGRGPRRPGEGAPQTNTE